MNIAADEGGRGYGRGVGRGRGRNMQAPPNAMDMESWRFNALYQPAGRNNINGDGNGAPPSNTVSGQDVRMRGAIGVLGKRSTDDSVANNKEDKVDTDMIVTGHVESSDQREDHVEDMVAAGNSVGNRIIIHSHAVGAEKNLAIITASKMGKSVVANLVDRFEGEDELLGSSSNQTKNPQKNANRKKLRGENGEALNNVDEDEEET